ncbi:MAG: cysteine-rich CWC family protein [Bacteroidales bacterium]|nr:cysteine-rich CWC family protein [Bacteroidales bacterium]
MKKSCPRCGKTFECVHTADCWCAKIHLSDVAKAKLKMQFNDCLCESCLREIAAEE